MSGFGRLKRYRGEGTDGLTRIPIFGIVCSIITYLLSAGERAASSRGPARRDGGRDHGRDRRRPERGPKARTAPRKSRRLVRRFISWSVRTGLGVAARVARFCLNVAALVARVCCYTVQRRVARRRAFYAETRSEREFGRRSLEHCAYILRRRKHNLLSPGTRAARRLVMDARQAVYVATEGNRPDMTEERAAAWLARLASTAGIELERLDHPRRWRRDVTEGAGRAVAVTHAAEPPRRDDRRRAHAPRAPRAEAAYEAPRHEERLVREPQPGTPARVEDEEAHAVVTSRVVAEDEPPAGFNLREDADVEEEVLQYLAGQSRDEEESVFSHAGD
jgi:hypothetical protein